MTEENVPDSVDTPPKEEKKAEPKARVLTVPNCETRYCPDCDGWNPDCTHGRYTGPYIEF